MVTFDHRRDNTNDTVSRVRDIYAVEDVGGASGLMYNRCETSSFRDLSIRQLVKISSGFPTKFWFISSIVDSMWSRSNSGLYSGFGGWYTVPTKLHPTRVHCNSNVLSSSSHPASSRTLERRYGPRRLRDDDDDVFDVAL